MIRFVFIAAALAAVQPAAIIGTWRGTSTCVDKVKFPACKDEVVVYEVKAHPTARDSVIVGADKVVNGARESMGESTHGRDSTGAWVSEFRTPRYGIRIVLRISGGSMSGELLDMPAADRVRRMALRKEP